MADDVYKSTVVGGLKLKGVKPSGIKKKKKKKNKAKEIESYASKGSPKQSEKNEENNEVEEQGSTKTPAEIAFEKAQQTRATERIMKKAAKTHKQRVEPTFQNVDKTQITFFTFPVGISTDIVTKEGENSEESDQSIQHENMGSDPDQTVESEDSQVVTETKESAGSKGHQDLLDAIVKADIPKSQKDIGNCLTVSFRRNVSMDRTQKDNEFMLIKTIDKEGEESLRYVGLCFVKGHGAEDHLEALKEGLTDTIGFDKLLQVASHLSTDGENQNVGKHKGLLKLIYNEG
eukprot:gene4545-20797_t